MSNNNIKKIKFFHLLRLITIKIHKKTVHYYDSNREFLTIFAIFFEFGYNTGKKIGCWYSLPVLIIKDA